MSQSEERGKWYGVRNGLTRDVCITNPAGTKYEISAPRLAQLDRDVATLLNDMLEGLIDLQNENEALRARDELRDRAEGQSAFDLQAQVEALKAARAADKAGFEVVIRELREEVERLTGGVDCKDEVLRLADDYAKTAWLDGRDGNKTSPMQELMRKSLSEILQGIGQPRGIWAKNQGGAK